jgi:hypothetical protein
VPAPDSSLPLRIAANIACYDSCLLVKGLPSAKFEVAYCTGVACAQHFLMIINIHRGCLFCFRQNEQNLERNYTTHVGCPSYRYIDFEFHSYSFFLLCLTCRKRANTNTRRSCYRYIYPSKVKSSHNKNKNNNKKITMANFLLRKASERRLLHRWQKQRKEEPKTAPNTTSTTILSSPRSGLPTRAMIQLLKGRNRSGDSEDSDMSTFGTTATTTTTTRDGEKQHQQQVISAPASCGRSPASVPSSSSIAKPMRQREDQQPQRSNTTTEDDVESLLIPTLETTTKKTTMCPATDSVLDNTKESTRTHPPPPHPTLQASSAASSSSTSSFSWQELWQRCVQDCYCLSQSNNKNKDNSESQQQQSQSPEYEYFQFLPFCVEEEDDLTTIIPKLVEQLQSNTKTNKALRHLQQLCDRDHEQNRIPLVCNNQWNLVSVLCQSIVQNPTTTWNDYRQALLILSNLTLPMENKAVLLLGPLRDVLLPALLAGLEQPTTTTTTQGSSTTASTSSTSALLHQRQLEKQLEIHLVCAILFNLSFLKDGKAILINYNNNNNKTLLMILQDLMRHFLPFATTGSSSSSDDSVERQALRWTLGMMRNLCQDTTLAVIIANTTEIPQMALELLHHSSAMECLQQQQQQQQSAASSLWRSQSLEDLALGMWIELALRENEASPTCLLPTLYQLKCRSHLQRIIPLGGIHGIRAQAIVKRFDSSSPQEVK